MLLATTSILLARIARFAVRYQGAFSSQGEEDRLEVDDLPHFEGRLQVTTTRLHLAERGCLRPKLTY